MVTNWPYALFIFISEWRQKCSIRNFLPWSIAHIPTQSHSPVNEGNRVSEERFSHTRKRCLDRNIDASTVTWFTTGLWSGYTLGYRPVSAMSIHRHSVRNVRRNCVDIWYYIMTIYTSSCKWKFDASFQDHNYDHQSAPNDSNQRTVLLHQFAQSLFFQKEVRCSDWRYTNRWRVMIILNIDFRKSLPASVWLFIY